MPLNYVDVRAVIAALAAIGAGLAAIPSQAAVIDTNAAAIINAVSVSDPASGAAFANSFVSVPYDLNTGGDAMAFATANENNVFRVFMFGGGGGSVDVSAQTQIQTTVTNTLGGPANFSFSFHIYAGSLQTFTFGAGGPDGFPPLQAGEFVQAEYAASVDLDGTTLFTSAASARHDSTGRSGTKSGVELSADDFSDGIYSWSAQTFTVDLGLFGDGESKLLTLSLLGQVTGLGGLNSVFTPEEFLDFYGVTCGSPESLAFTRSVLSGDQCLQPDIQGVVNYGDPGVIDGTTLSPAGAQFVTGALVTAPQEVPEPASLTLLGAGLLGLGAVALRRRQRVAA